MIERHPNDESVLCRFNRHVADECSRVLKSAIAIGLVQWIVQPGHGHFNVGNPDKDNLPVHASVLSEMSNHPEDEPFDAKGIGLFYDNRLHRVVGGMQFDRSRFPVIDHNRGLSVHQRNHCLTISSGCLLLHDNNIVWVNPVVAHRVSLHP